MNLAWHACHDVEALRAAIATQWRMLDAVNSGERGRLGFQAPDKGIYRARVAPRIYQHAIAVVQHFSAEAAVGRKAPHGWAEPHSLYEAAHPDLATLVFLPRKGRNAAHSLFLIKADRRGPRIPSGDHIERILK